MRATLALLIGLVVAVAMLSRSGDVDASVVLPATSSSRPIDAATADATPVREAAPALEAEARTPAPGATPPDAAPWRVRAVGRFRVTEPDGTPIADATLVHSDPPQRTDADGRITAETEGTTWFEFAAPGCLQGGAIPAKDGSEVHVVLQPALRLCVRVHGGVDLTAVHARVHLPANAKPGPYYPCVTSKYEQTPGCGVDDTNARWTHRKITDPTTGRPDWKSHWELQLSPAGIATLDHVEFEGEAVVELCHFDTVLERRSVPFPQRRGTSEVVFERAGPAARLVGRVVDDRGRAVTGASLRMGAAGGYQVVDSQFTRRVPFPVWGPEAVSDGLGAFDLPRPPSADCRIVVTAPGFAARAVTVAEIDAANETIGLQPGRTILLQAVDSLGQPLVVGPTTGGEDVVEPCVHLGHDVWRGPSGGEPPWFEFDGLPAGVVEFKCLGDRFAHDVRKGNARYQADCPVDELGIGK